MPGVVQVHINDGSDRNVTGLIQYDRDNGGTFVPPYGAAFPSTPVAGEFFYRTDQGAAYRRNNANTAWDVISGSTDWGSIGGTLSDQTDLQSALDAKADNSVLSSHTGDSSIHFTESSIEHNGITGHQGGQVGQYYHLDSAQHTIATQAASATVSGYLNTTDWNAFNNKVSGPGSSTDNAVVRFDSTTGKIIQNSNATLSDAGNFLTSGNIQADPSGSTEGSPRLYGNSESMAAGEATRFAFSATSNGFQTSYDNTAFQFYGYGSIVLYGNRQAAGPSWEDIQTHNVIIKGDNDSPVLGIDADPAGQTSDLTQWRDGSLNVIASIDGSGNLQLRGNREIRFYDDGNNYVGFEAPALTANQIWVLPVADGTNGQVLTTNGTGTLSWTTPTGGGTGDVTGPASSTDNALVRFDSTTGKLIQNSNATLSDAGVLNVASNIYANANGSTNTSPRIIGFSNFSSGEATRLDMDGNGGLQTEYGGSMTLYCYNTLVLRGNRNAATPSFDADYGVGVLVDTATDQPSFVVRGIASQTADVQQWRASNDDLLFRILPNGDLVMNTGQSFYIDNGTNLLRAITATETSLYIGQDTGDNLVTLIDFESSTNQTWSISGSDIMELTSTGLQLNNYDLTEVKTASFNQWGAVTATSSAATVAFDDYQQCTIDLNDQSSCTITLNVPNGPAAFKLILEQGGTTPTTTITWATEGTHALYAPNGNITVASGAGEITMIGLWYDGADWFAVSSQPMETVVAN